MSHQLGLRRVSPDSCQLLGLQADHLHCGRGGDVGGGGGGVQPGRGGVRGQPQPGQMGAPAAQAALASSPPGQQGAGQEDVPGARPRPGPDPVLQHPPRPDLSPGQPAAEARGRAQTPGVQQTPPHPLRLRGVGQHRHRPQVQHRPRGEGVGWQLPRGRQQRGPVLVPDDCHADCEDSTGQSDSQVNHRGNEATSEWQVNIADRIFTNKFLQIFG